MFARFAICLAPLIITGICFVLTASDTIPKRSQESFGMLCIFLTAIGALLSGFFVARAVYRAIAEPKWWKILAAVLVFVLVAVGYFTIGFFAGCLMLLANFH